MNKKGDQLADRLVELAGPTQFRGDYDNASQSSEDLLAMGRHNLAEFEKLQSLGEETQERIERLTRLLVARELQKEALVRYGIADEAAIREVLMSLYAEPENRAFCDRIAKLSIEGMADADLTEEQRIQLNEYFRLLPQIQIEAIAEEVSKFQYLPLESSGLIAEKLADFLKEVPHEHR